MIVIEGKAQKSIKLVELLKERNKDEYILFIDKKWGNSPVFQDINGFIANTDDFMSYYQHNKSDLKKYKTVAIYFNIDPEDIDAFKELERHLRVELIITVQNNDLEELKVYEI